MKNNNNIFKEYLDNIDSSFRKIMKGEEDMKNVIWWWGGIPYLVVYFLFNSIIRASQNSLVTLFLSSLVIAYFSWHIFALKKCQPKKPKLTKEQKKKIKLEKRKNFSKSFFRKLTLQEPISKWNTVHVLIALNLLYILIFFEYIIE